MSWGQLLLHCLGAGVVADPLVELAMYQRASYPVVALVATVVGGGRSRSTAVSTTIIPTILSYPLA